MLRNIVIRWFVNALAIAVASHLLPGIFYFQLVDLLLAAAILGLLNAIIKPILIILTLPINIISLGLFTLVINAFLLALTGSFLSGFVVEGFWPALIGAFIISIVSMILNSILKEEDRA